MSIEPFRKTRFGYRLIQFTARAFFKIVFGLRVEGLENVPKTGAFIIAANHKSLLDPPMVGSTCPRELYFAAKRELFSVPVMGAIIKYVNSVPVNRSGYDREVITLLGEAMKAGYGIIIFPEGTRYVDEVLHAPKAGIGMIAVRNEVPILPVFIKGNTILGKQIFRRSLRVKYGVPFNLEDLDLEGLIAKEKYRIVAWETMKRIASIGGVDPPSQNDPTE